MIRKLAPYTKGYRVYILLGILCSAGEAVLDINTMVVKLAIQELSKDTDCLITTLDQELNYDFYMWANRRELHFANWAPFNNNPGRKKPTILQWYGVKFPKSCDCNECKHY